MTVELTRVPNADATEPSEKWVGLQVIGTLHKSDYEVLGPQLELQLEQHGKIRLLIELVDFHGWTTAAAWEDAKLTFKHFRHIDRIAVVGDSRWEKGMTSLAKPFIAAEVRYFDVGESEAAEAWIQQ